MAELYVPTLSHPPTPSFPAAAGTGNPEVIYQVDPNVENLTPADPTLPAVAYSQDGTKPHYGWDVSGQTWV